MVTSAALNGVRVPNMTPGLWHSNGFDGYGDSTRAWTARRKSLCGRIWLLAYTRM